MRNSDNEYDFTSYKNELKDTGKWYPPILPSSWSGNKDRCEQWMYGIDIIRNNYNPDNGERLPLIGSIIRNATSIPTGTVLYDVYNAIISELKTKSHRKLSKYMADGAGFKGFLSYALNVARDNHPEYFEITDDNGSIIYSMDADKLWNLMMTVKGNQWPLPATNMNIAYNGVINAASESRLLEHCNGDRHLISIAVNNNLFSNLVDIDEFDAMIDVINAYSASINKIKASYADGQVVKRIADEQLYYDEKFYYYSVCYATFYASFTSGIESIKSGLESDARLIEKPLHRKDNRLHLIKAMKDYASQLSSLSFFNDKDDYNSLVENIPACENGAAWSAAITDVFGESNGDNDDMLVNSFLETYGGVINPSVLAAIDCIVREDRAIKSHDADNNANIMRWIRSRKKNRRSTLLRYLECCFNGYPNEFSEQIAKTIHQTR